MNPIIATGGLIENRHVRNALAAALIALPAMASAGCWDSCCSDWAEFKAACECEGGTAVPDPPRCVGSGSGGTVAPVDPGMLRRRRFQAILQRGVLDAATFGSLPIGTDDEFASALNMAHAALYRSVAVSEAEWNHWSAKTAADLAGYEDFYTPRFSVIDASDDLDPGIRAERRAARDELASLTAEAARLKDTRDRFVRRASAPANAQRLNVEASTTAKKRLFVYFGGLTKSDVEGFSEAMSTGVAKGECCDESPFVQPTYWIQGPTMSPDHAMAVIAARNALDAARNVEAPVLWADDETRLGQVEDLAGRAATAEQGRDAAQRYYEDVVMPRMESGRRTWKAIGDENVAVLKETHQLVTQAIPAMRVELKAAQDVLAGETWEFFMNGGKAAAWELFRTNAVEPEIKRLGIEAFHGRTFSLTDEEVEEAWAHDQHALFGAYADYSRAKDIYALIETAKNLEGTAEESALAVANVLGRADLGDYQEVGDRLFAGVDAAARAEVREALGQASLPLPFKKFWEAYFTGVKPTF